MHAQRGLVLFLIPLIVSDVFRPWCLATSDEYWSETNASLRIEGVVNAILPAGTNIYLAGLFTGIQEARPHIVVHWSANRWVAVGNGVTEDFVEGINPIATSLALENGQIHVGGAFSKIGNEEALNIARWDGTNWFRLGEGINGIVRALAASNGKLYAGGSFSRAGDTSASNVAVWDGEKWSALGQGLPGEAVDSLAANETTVYAGGRFYRGAGVQATNIARWDGTDWKPLGKGIRASETFAEGAIVRALWLNGTHLYAGGGFGWAGDVRTRNVARWDGAQWQRVGSGIVEIGEVHALIEVSNLLYAGGFFSTNGRHIARWNGTEWISLGTGVEGEFGIASGVVYALASNPTELFVGGGFNQAGGKPAQNLAVWQFPQTLQVVGFGEALSVSWPAPDTNFVLEATSSLTNPHWSPVAQEPVLQNYRRTVTNAINGEKQFFRLRRRGGP